MSSLLKIDNLTVAFNTDRGEIRPVQQVSLSVNAGQTVAVVGESGCGKSVTALSILRLIPSPPGRVIAGDITLEDRNLLTLTEPQMRQVRGREIAMIFQEPMTSLNPVYTIGDQIAEAVILHQHVNLRQALVIAEQAMRDVGIADPHRRLSEYPHQLSGGMRQRVMIAMALSCKPKLLIADEPTTALDVTIQAQILELLRHLQRTTNMAVLLITHDLGVVAENADVVAVMYASRIVEYAPVEQLFDSPAHPYTRGLFAAVPRLSDTSDRLAAIPGSVANPADFPTGCKFHPRCELTRRLAAECADASQYVDAMIDRHAVRIMRRCVDTEPDLRQIDPEHWAACHFAANYDQSPATTPSSGHRRAVLVEAELTDPAVQGVP